MNKLRYVWDLSSELAESLVFVPQPVYRVVLNSEAFIYVYRYTCIIITCWLESLSNKKLNV